MLDCLGEICGYVYFTSSYSFVYHCKYCGCQFKTPSEFEDHKIKEHIGVNLIELDNIKKFENEPLSPTNSEYGEYLNFGGEDNEVFENNIENGRILHFKIEKVESSDKEYSENSNFDDLFYLQNEENSLDQGNYLDSQEISLTNSNTDNSENNQYLYNNEEKNQISREIYKLNSKLKEEEKEEVKVENLEISDKENDFDEEYDNKELNIPTTKEEKYDFKHFQTDDTAESSKNIEFQLNDIEIKDLRCKFCKKQFNKRLNLFHHIENHLSYALTCKICGKHSSIRRLAQLHRKTHLKKSCDQCDSAFSSDLLLEKHKKKHELLKCKFCPKVFKTLFAVRNHVRTHTGEKPYKCEECSVAFALKRNLQTHIVTQHTGDVKNFSCKFCDRKFKTKQLHNWHIKRVHFKEKPSQCEICGLNFANTSGLRRHKLKHHTDYNERPHHCELCDKKFVELKNLTEHMNTHTGRKPFKCDVCLKGFGQYSTLREHKKLHSGTKTHICKLCGKAFAQLSGCTNHMKVQHRTITNSN